MQRALAVLVVLALSSNARADDKHRREVHGAAILGGLALIGVVELGIKPYAAPDHCRWCDPPSLDVSVRNALVWNNVKTARDLSNYAAVVSPVALLSMLAIADDADHHGYTFIDDVTPVAEATVGTILLHQIVKLSVGRERPFVHFAAPGTHTPDSDDDMSFYSGHTAMTFAIATSAGMVAHERGYKIEPLVWATGLALAAGTGYLRIAGDKHYLTDVMTGAVVGSATGIAVPLLFDKYLRESGTTVMPAGKVVLVSGTW